MQHISRESIKGYKHWQLWYKRNKTHKKNEFFVVTVTPLHFGLTNMCEKHQVFYYLHNTYVGSLSLNVHVH